MVIDQDCFTSINRLINCNWPWPIVLQWRPHCYFTKLSDTDMYYMYLVTMKPLVHLFANQHCHSTLTIISITSTYCRCLTFNLTCTVSYTTYVTYVVIYVLYACICHE